MSRAEWARDPGDRRWFRCGDADLGVVESEREPGRWAPAYAGSGEAAGGAGRYLWTDLLDAIRAAARITAEQAARDAGADPYEACAAGQAAARAAEVRS